MMKDWLTKGRTEKLANSNMDKIEVLMSSCGFAMDPKKRACGQIIPYLGIELNTIKMTMKMDKTQCRNIQIEMSFYLEKLESKAFITPTQICHIAEVINWYCEVIQSGRIHSIYWWKYMRKGNNLSDFDRKHLIADTIWWIDLLSIWADDRYQCNEYMLSASELQKPDQVFVLQSDSSGTDGFGCDGGILGDLNQQYTSCTWQSYMFTECNQINSEHNNPANLFTQSPPGVLKTPPENSQLSAKAKIFTPTTTFGNPLTINGLGKPHQLPQSSIWGEIYALKHFLEHTLINDKLFVWVSDSLNAVYDINKGRCGSEADAELLRSIFYYCDRKRLQIIAIWVPRELNIMADYLSHLSYISDRDLVSGNVTDLEGAHLSS
jgi:hypothetical protein